jgi:hypothetical protein
VITYQEDFNLKTFVLFIILMHAAYSYQFKATYNCWKEVRFLCF